MVKTLLIYMKNKWGYRIKAITMVLQIIEHGALPCNSTMSFPTPLG